MNEYMKGWLDALKHLARSLSVRGLASPVVSDEIARTARIRPESRLIERGEESDRQSEEAKMNDICVTIRIEEDQKAVYYVIVEVEGRDQISVESCIEELRALAINWAKSWLKYPDIAVTIRNKEA